MSAVQIPLRKIMLSGALILYVALNTYFHGASATVYAWEMLPPPATVGTQTTSGGGASRTPKGVSGIPVVASGTQSQLQQASEQNSAANSLAKFADQMGKVVVAVYEQFLPNYFGLELIPK